MKRFSKKCQLQVGRKGVKIGSLLIPMKRQGLGRGHTSYQAWFSKRIFQNEVRRCLQLID